MTKPQLLYYNQLQYQDATLASLKRHFEIRDLPDPSFDTEEELSGTEVLMAPLGHRVDKKKIDRCPRLKVIASSTLATPHIDSDYAKTKGIQVCSLDGQRDFLNTITATAELTWGLILAVTRHMPAMHEAACRAEWGGRPWGRRTPHMLSAMSLGIVGLGRLGSIVARYGKAFGMKVFYYSPHSEDPAYEKIETLDELAAKSDVISIHAAQTPETDAMIGKTFFAKLRPGSFLVSTSRGELVDEAALLEALESGHLGGAALDGLAGEYLPGFKERLSQHPLVEYARKHDNLIITPHYAGATRDAWSETEAKLVEIIVDAIRPALTSN